MIRNALTGEPVSKKNYKVLNLYSGIGGNRKPWSNCDVTAIEYDENIAKIYKELYPNDNVIVADAHQYLLEHFREFDFIWASPPCPSHSRIRKTLAMKKKKDGTIYEQNKPVYPDMKLYEEIILLDNYYDGIYVVENVIPYYEALIEPQKLGRHYFWSNVELPPSKFERRGNFDDKDALAEEMGIDISGWHNVNKTLLLRNCVEYSVADYIWKKVENELNGQTTNIQK